MTKIKLLSLTNCLLEYRLPVYNLLAEKFDLTIAHYGESVAHRDIHFKEILLTPIIRGPFTFSKEKLTTLAAGFDAVIALGELRMWSFLKLGFVIKRKYALTYWNIGVSASYNKRYDEDRSLDFFRFNLLNRADSIVFYTDYPIKRYVEDGGVQREKLFVANNTVEVKERIQIPFEKKHFLFVGTLYKAKKIYDLLEAYKKAYEMSNNIYPLVIIGEGIEKENVLKFIKEQQLQHKISVKGAIYDQEVLKVFYTDAIALISPGQAGLTVLNAFAYGVPFVTTKTAITGGEIFNIKNEINGLLYDDNHNNLKNIILELTRNPQKVYQMSVNAQNHYFEHSTLDKMVEGLSQAILYAVNCKKKQNNQQLRSINK
ncbi:glycosyltransferase family 4 protein [Wenyingzhuangia marina]|uniref:Glycosyltransferase involved in cell wall bisynthesis n=1 Tax=Wenyingzhuangia marina TaxID=1195760 RepID=A0A1M5X262_9FLAO|nr:glycosyltransferase family 4 protein [Wenyingzhuangia marina]GGF60914.1 glycosyl transferase [Wenyingzhuangia marina]SHH93574.1 Glycosyltransferase involved in cell wall bisynthesis [Wenyingzhuangia marina]